MNRIAHELKQHMPFTFFGALTGIICMELTMGMSHDLAHRLFYVFHPLHVVLSALVTASMYKLYILQNGKKLNVLKFILIGYVGSVGIATLSDSLIPYLGETMLGLQYRAPHIGFIEEWWLVNPAAFVGIALAYIYPHTKFPHAAHVLLSTWASLFHILMAMGGEYSSYVYLGIFFFLFLSVWLPCCVSDIVFPLLFVKERE
ncbi:MAG: hypothetical protein PHH49_02605 [Candidatus Omnitrophica bacterium]|nr:hypothetical protein [Candidatus Omnitrophota bacterium]MDD5487839.1 hypothetical protein [Candidatus Omnitrophota bacterium]